LHRSFGF